MSITGTVCAMVTPWDAQGQLDVAMTHKLANWLADRGVDALFVGGTTGEGILLSEQERRTLTEEVIAAVGKRVKILVQVGSASTRETASLAAHAQQAGADGIAALAPYYFAADRLAMVRHFTTVAAAVPGLPVYLYNIPGNTRNPITPAIVADVLAQADNVAGIKDSAKDLVLLQKFLTFANDRFSVLVGSDSVLLPGLAVGCVGGVSAASTAFPEAVVAVVQAFAAGNLSAAQAAQAKLNSLLDVLKIGPTPAGYKAVLALRGMNVGGVRGPLRPLTDEENERLNAAFVNLDLD
ncbi:MAG TPA: dihydrodipicolinate synthase family protein [bacterium]|nr:dihydrodipicolinate synthase family protein [bacterium]